MGIFEIVTESIDIEELSNAIKSADKALLRKQFTFGPIM